MNNFILYINKYFVKGIYIVSKESFQMLQETEDFLMNADEKRGNGYGQDPNPEHGNDNQGHSRDNGNHHGQEKKATHAHGIICTRY